MKPPYMLHSSTLCKLIPLFRIYMFYSGIRLPLYFGREIFGGFVCAELADWKMKDERWKMKDERWKMKKSTNQREMENWKCQRETHVSTFSAKFPFKFQSHLAEWYMKHFNAMLSITKVNLCHFYALQKDFNLWRGIMVFCIDLV
jgi:hypothetical protein